MRPRSVLRDHRATPAVVDARGDHVDVLLDAVGPREYASEISEVVGVPSHEQMVVLNTSRPVLREGEFDTGADRAAPASLFRLVDRHAGHKTKPVYLSSATAAPPLTYQRTLFQAYPAWPVNRPSALILLWLVTAGPKNRLVFEPFRPAQSPWASRAKTHDEACQR